MYCIPYVREHPEVQCSVQYECLYSVVINLSHVLITNIPHVHPYYEYQQLSPIYTYVIVSHIALSAHHLTY